MPEFEITEDGETFEENSYKKAYEIMKATGKTTIADDSGLMVDYLGGAPGVYSARFAGEEHNDAKNNEKLLKLLKKRSQIIKDEFSKIPYELKFLAYFMNLKSDDYKKITKFLNESYGGV